ncbi:hypothetical protein BDW02DRAFT_419576 [Decorospora gaudefroyi]|uniref:F-box domain-containing protein n=1 Tax=Decorospora gaudefroyi TaxID=184978 RepID=A0A6A5K8P6_9PLEO|nr:hypothetical protein BDW02DRAFT_419576 [Decorospora gaudefroyi]
MKATSTPNRPLVLFYCSILIRFVVLAPTVFYQKHASKHYEIISDHAKLHDGTYDTAIFVGEKIANRWASVVFYWNISIAIASAVFIPPFNFPIVVVDTLATVYLSLATHYQTGYVPHSKSACHLSDTSLMQPPQGVNESFFAAAARLNATAALPADICANFVEEWQYGITLSFFYALMALIGIYAICSTLREVKKTGKSLRNMFGDMGKLVWQLVIGIAKCLVVSSWCLIWLIPQMFFRYLPRNIQGPIRSVRRYIVKLGLGATQKTELTMVELTTELQKKKNGNQRYQGGDGEPTQLATFLSVYDILVLVSEQLHYIDIITLSRVSKSVRESVLPSQDFSRRLKIFRLYSCQPDHKLDCWTCTTQICIDCQHLPLLPRTTIHHHIDICRPYCSSCFKTHVLHEPYEVCSCAPAPAYPRTPLQRFVRSFRFFTKAQRRLRKVQRPVCRECNRLTEEDLLALRERQAKLELKRGLKSNGEVWTTCTRSGCDRDLGRGPRWWVCRQCGGECVSRFHKAVGRAQKHDDGHGQVIGEEAV